MVKLTVFTPTYNRSDLLERGYLALKRQTNKDFIWLVIDDGSIDKTKEIVEEWINTESEFKIEYIHKENGGLHTAYNSAIENLSTELAVCVDSDDYLTDTAVEEILKLWDQVKNDGVAGIVAPDCYQNGEIIGDNLPDQKTINLIDLQVGKYNINNGDRKLVVRSDLYKSVAPQKVFDGEKNFNPHFMHLQISKSYDFAVYRNPICIVEYQPTGMSANMIKQYWNSPKSFAEMRKLYLSFPNTSFRYKFKHSIHYVSSSLIAKNRRFVKESPQKLLTILAFPFGFVFYCLIKKIMRKKDV